ncbi:hypothetical protein GH817_27630 [Bacillus thuringiensis]|nr:hypothetical protein [Bacillus thuringiensis]
MLDGDDVKRLGHADDDVGGGDRPGQVAGVGADDVKGRPLLSERLK